ncbi:MAG TPA: protein phosphatase 2C domain-containing protein [Enterobacteriaceae bacterium]|nr:protein phosphatase 2C domain-containing protein [Enterobacteriaceae bacterium]
MNTCPSVEHKILTLILEEAGLAIDDATAETLFADPHLADSVRQLISDVKQKAASAPDIAAPLAEPGDVQESETPLTGQENLEVEEEPAPDASPAEPETSPEADVADTTEKAWEPMPFEPLEKPAQPCAETEALRPGQVPSPSASASDAPRVTAPPAAKITLANARVDEFFQTRIEVTLENGADARVLDVRFPTESSLQFDPETQILSGTPTESGDTEITVVWSCASHPECESRQLFIVNPNPRSLWKVVEPPSDAPYFKENLDHKNIIAAGVNIAAASRRGRSHEHAGTFRDDDFYINLSLESGWSVLLVADGAGSAKNSREGSRIATQTAGEYLFDQLKGDNGIALKERILRWDAEDQQQVWDTINRHFRQAAALSVNNISREAILAEEKVKTYATTLLATLTFREGDELFAASFWLGDGAIAAYGPTGKVRLLGAPDSGEYAGQTRFLDADAVQDAGFSKRISIGKWSDVTHLILMTDGVSDPLFETDNGLQNAAKWDSLLADLSPSLADPAMASLHLVEWLNFFSPGNHDDRTLIVSW